MPSERHIWIAAILAGFLYAVCIGAFIAVPLGWRP